MCKIDARINADSVSAVIKINRQFVSLKNKISPTNIKIVKNVQENKGKYEKK